MNDNTPGQDDESEGEQDVVAHPGAELAIDLDERQADVDAAEDPVAGGTDIDALDAQVLLALESHAAPVEAPDDLAAKSTTVPRQLVDVNEIGVETMRAKPVSVRRRRR